MIIAGAFPFSFGSLINNLLQKCMYSAMLKFKSVLKNCFPAFLLSPFLLSPSMYHFGLDAYALLPRLYGISAITSCALGIPSSYSFGNCHYIILFSYFLERSRVHFDLQELHLLSTLLMFSIIRCLGYITVL